MRHDTSLNGPVPTATPPGTPYLPSGWYTPSDVRRPLSASFSRIAVGLWIANGEIVIAGMNGPYGRFRLMTATFEPRALQLRYSASFAPFVLKPAKTTL